MAVCSAMHIKDLQTQFHNSFTKPYLSHRER